MSSTVRMLSATRLLCLALGVLILAGCRASSASPTVGSAIQNASAGPTSTAAVENPAVDELQTELQPTATPASDRQDSTASETTAESDPDENVAPTAENAPIEETRAANADVEFVRATQQADGTWRFEVTVRHPDTGWEDYADGWDVVTPDGQVLKVNEEDPFTRLLLHPHENEQPFTRSQSDIVVPDGVTVLIVRAHDLVDGFGGQELEVDLTVDQGPGFEVSRQ